jgi:plastocyanin
MRPRSLLVMSLVVLLSLALAPGALAHGSNRGPGGGGGDDDEGRAAAPATVPTAAAPTPSGASSAVTIVNRAFSPAAVSVPAGTSVSWVNRDGAEHTVTADNGSFDSGTLTGGGQFAFTFPTPGAFAYFCAIHIGMRVTVRVTGSAANAAVPTPPAGLPTTTTSVAAPPSSTDAAIEVRDYEFTPAKLTVGRGTEVTWTNAGKATHTVTGEGFDSGDLAANASFAHRFSDAGTYSYRCTIHPRMTGVVEVVADATATPIASPEPSGIPLETAAAGAIVGAPLLLLAGLGLIALRTGRLRR